MTGESVMSQPSQSTTSTNITAHAPVTAEILNRGCAGDLDPERLRRQMKTACCADCVARCSVFGLRMLEIALEAKGEQLRLAPLDGSGSLIRKHFLHGRTRDSGSALFR